MSDLWHQGPHQELLDEFAFVSHGPVPPRRRQQEQRRGVQPLDDRARIEIGVELARLFPALQQWSVVHQQQSRPSAPTRVAEPRPPRCSRRRTAPRSMRCRPPTPPAPEPSRATSAPGRRGDPARRPARPARESTRASIRPSNTSSRLGKYRYTVERDTPASSATSAIRIWALPRRTMQRPAASRRRLRASSSSRIARSSPHRRLGSMQRYYGMRCAIEYLMSQLWQEIFHRCCVTSESIRWQ